MLRVLNRYYFVNVHDWLSCTCTYGTKKANMHLIFQVMLMIYLIYMYKVLQEREREREKTQENEERESENEGEIVKEGREIL